MNTWPALTPALSPRRGGAEIASVNSTVLAAFVAYSKAEISVLPSGADIALPLLGERAGVRANISSIH
jgi:hypothetical protein